MALISSLNSGTVYSRHGSSRSSVVPNSFWSNDVGLPATAFEYKPALPVSQFPLDIIHKFKFDKLESPPVKRRRLSAESHNQEELPNDQLEQSQYEGIAPKEEDKQLQYGRAWLMRFIVSCSEC